ncbi:protein ARV1 isoform X3 [Ischnura elegans]|uniref:protein ARV1 isoform X3 n=1 Tax=Ischnura elegans TaxID=197161 RepID=UPI001ED887A3|nr:protein ARV1 isoform X3 [Ischnura elegans]
MDKSSTPVRKENYACINCGSAVGELFKEYSPSVLKMSNCGNCQKMADKYIEYDPVIVIIDLALLNRQAYRHVIFNTSFKRLAILQDVSLLLEHQQLYV